MSNKRSFPKEDDEDDFSWEKLVQSNTSSSIPIKKKTNRLDLMNDAAVQQYRDEQLQEPTTTRPSFHVDSDYDSDNEPPPVFLDWRTDPVRSFSDWRIDVIVKRSSDVEPVIWGTYNVHKNVLVVESEYFQNLFDLDRNGGSFSESKCSTSTIELVQQGAESFEALLDYIYRPGEPNLTTENAIALHHFGEYFGMKRLRWLARQFWKADLNSRTVATYYKHAGIFLDDKVMQAVKRKCCSVPFLIEAGSSGLLLDVNDPQLWFFLLKQFNGACSVPLSAFVCEYCDRHQVDAVVFVQMTAKSVLPEIFFDVAQQLVELEKKILGASVELTCLQIRCIAALSKDWKRIDVTSDSFSAFLADQSPKFSVELFKQSMLAARNKNDC